MSYTFAEHATRCRQAAENNQVLQQFVQIKSTQVTTCGRIVDCWTHPTGVDLWRIELIVPFKGLTYQAVNRVRPCSGLDGRCSCAGESVQPFADTCATQAKRGGQGGEKGLEGVTC